MKQRSGEALTEMEQLLLETEADATLVRWQYVYGEWKAGLIDADEVPVENWHYAFSNNPAMQKHWRVNVRPLSAKSGHPLDPDTNILNVRFRGRSGSPIQPR